MISKYNEFLLENMINESMLYFSPPLRELLNDIDNDVARDLISIENTDVKSDNTFLDIDDKDGYVSFITMSNAKNYIDPEQINDVNVNDLWDTNHIKGSVYKKSRNVLKLGKLVNKLFPNKYSSQDVEVFVNAFKSNLINEEEEFRLVEGDDIDHWYSYRNYKEMEGQLGKSCMAKSNGIFEMYTENPEVCRLLILVENGKLIGRALVWKFSKLSNRDTNISAEYYMDRQYTILDSDVNKFIKYANLNGWVYFRNHSYYYKKEVLRGSSIEVSIKDIRYNKFPYMDTFKRYDNSGTLYDDEDGDSGDYILTDTTGGYSEANMLYSDYYDVFITEDETVYSEAVESYLPIDRAVNITDGYSRNQGWYPTDHEEIVYDEYNGIYIHIEDSTYCDSYGYFVLSDDKSDLP